MKCQTEQGTGPFRRCAAARLTGAVLLLTQLATSAHAGPNEQAKRIYERIAGEPPAAAVLGQMATAISGSPGQPGLLAAAAIATSAPSFYNVTLKNLVIPWTNRDQTVFAPFNDYAADRHRHDPRRRGRSNTALSDDILYIVNAPGLPAPSAREQQSLRHRGDERR